MTDPGSDIIFALSSAPGRAALHLHRVSGAGCLARLLPWLRRTNGGSLTESDLHARRAHHLLILSPQIEGGGVLDDGLVIPFAAGASFTGEESLEITTHGNPLISASLQGLFRRLGFRDAAPGEFTQRAYLNGRLDLTQAEAIRTLIDAETEDGVALARAGSDGAVQKGLEPIRADLLQVRALLEAQIDFAEDEVGQADWVTLGTLCGRVASGLETLESSYKRGQILLEGVSVALVGPPNAGKSSLYNALLSENRAIVSSEKGTTRDVLKERFRAASRDFVLLDTAGLRHTDHDIERQGIEKSFEVVAKAQVVVLVLDLHDLREQRTLAHPEQPETSLAQTIARDLSEQMQPGSRLIVALNKCDLLTGTESEAEQSAHTQALGLPCVLTQASDVSALEAALVQAHDALSQAGPRQKSGALAAVGATLFSQRQRDAAAKAKSHALEAKSMCDNKTLPEIVASELLACEEALHELLGRIPPEEVLHAIFGQFCIGK